MAVSIFIFFATFMQCEFNLYKYLKYNGFTS